MRHMAESLSADGRLLASVPNISHWYSRGRIALGLFNYDQRGILDRTHLRFFTRRSFLQLVRRCHLTQSQPTTRAFPSMCCCLRVTTSSSEPRQDSTRPSCGCGQPFSAISSCTNSRRPVPQLLRFSRVASRTAVAAGSRLAPAWRRWTRRWLRRRRVVVRRWVARTSQRRTTHVRKPSSARDRQQVRRQRSRTHRARHPRTTTRNPSRPSNQSVVLSTPASARRRRNSPESRRSSSSLVVW